jgi:uncharacterized protein YndB with AHSA1/START domain
MPRMSTPANPGHERTADRELVTSRLIAAPRARVWRAFADPLLLARWWGPSGFSNSFEHFELRPGGSWRFVMHGPDGVDHPNEIVFTEVLDQQRIVFDHVTAPRFEVTLTFSDHGDRTALGWRQRFESAEQCRRISPIAAPANEQNIDRLAALLHATA